ncbi:MAG: GntR family transcriptional regulator [Sulfuritalea sp.]|jgi:DNA-binding GntR family transcriptional regulator|nr:GntR family transcriptional regulator [Sulfuritalea sp.]MDP1982850.1 GntR family transcriptional regulator [Sulfuritalea sp.]
MNTSIKPLERPAGLADRVYHQLRDSIGSHHIRPGERLQEVSLAAQLGVSRTPVREALARLESEGMIAVEGRGFVVPELTDADIEEIYQLRFLLEPAAARTAVAEISSPSDLASMASAIDDAVTADKNGDFRAFLDANSRFHNAWRALIPNRRMSKLLDQYVGHVRFLRVLTLGNPSARKTALTGMKNIHAAFKKRDADAAAAAMHKHLEAAKHFLITAIEEIDQEKQAEQSASVR